MKKLFLLFLFSGSLDGFSQVPDTTQPLRQFYTCWYKRADFRIDTLVAAPDTLRAICLVTLFPNGIAHARMGFVVICEGKEVEYLDCRKRALKLPQVGWRYRLIDPNEKVR